MSTQASLERGLSALKAWSWAEARVAFEEVMATNASAEALEGLRVGAVNYGWDQCQLHAAAKRIFEDAGDGVLRRFRQLIPDVGPDASDGELETRLLRRHNGSRACSGLPDKPPERRRRSKGALRLSRVRIRGRIGPCGAAGAGLRSP